MVTVCESENKSLGGSMKLVAVLSTLAFVVAASAQTGTPASAPAASSTPAASAPAASAPAASEKAPAKGKKAKKNKKPAANQ
jgi:hypothetical protein